MSAAAAAAVKVRRTNEERSAETRARLLEATTECLVELGYSNTTTTAIAERAGVSRGAQLHHYPTKAELVTAAVEHLCERLDAEFRAAIVRVPEGGQPEVLDIVHHDTLAAFAEKAS